MLSNMQIRKDVSREAKIYLELNENSNTSKFVGCIESSA